MAKSGLDGIDDEPPPSSTQARGKHVVDAIRRILSWRFEVSSQAVALSSRFVEDLGIDVFDLPDLILALEETFELDIPLVLAARILTVKDAVNCVLSRAHRV